MDTTNIETIKLGKQLPWKQFQRPGDYVTAVLTENGFDIIISLSNLSEQEEEAIGNNEFMIYLVPIECIPFLVLQFGDVFKSDLTINIANMKETDYNKWIQSKEKTITLYLLEGSDATLQCLRYFDYGNISMIRSICEGQRNYPSEIIESCISEICAKASIEDLISGARCVDIIPAVSLSL